MDSNFFYLLSFSQYHYRLPDIFTEKLLNENDIFKSVCQHNNNVPFTHTHHIYIYVHNAQLFILLKHFQINTMPLNR